MSFPRVYPTIATATSAYDSNYKYDSYMNVKITHHLYDNEMGSSYQCCIFSFHCKVHQRHSREPCY